MMDLHATGSRPGIISQVFGFSAAMLGVGQTGSDTQPEPEIDPGALPHRFLLLPFEPDVLSAMKRYGNRECARVQSEAESGGEEGR